MIVYRCKCGKVDFADYAAIGEKIQCASCSKQVKVPGKSLSGYLVVCREHNQEGTIVLTRKEINERLLKRTLHSNDLIWDGGKWRRLGAGIEDIADYTVSGGNLKTGSTMFSAIKTLIFLAAVGAGIFFFLQHKSSETNEETSSPREFAEKKQGKEKSSSSVKTELAPPVLINFGGNDVGQWKKDGKGRAFSSKSKINISGVKYPAPAKVYSSELYGKVSYTWRMS